MLKRNYLFISFALILFIGLFITTTAYANSLVEGELVKITYKDVRIDDEITAKRLDQIFIKNNKNGMVIPIGISEYTQVFINTLPVTVDGLKPGMQVEMDVDLRRAKEIRAISGASQGKIEVGDKAFFATVNQIDPNGKFLFVRLDQGETKKYVLNDATEIFKEKKLVDLSVIYEGDRVKLSFSKYDTDIIDMIEVNTQGIKIEALYKAKIERIDPHQNKLIVKDQMQFIDWKWRLTNANKDRFGDYSTSNNSYTYTTKAPIYVGDREIARDRLNYYADQDVYFVTVSQFGKEVIERIVIKKMNETTFYETFASINTKDQKIDLLKTKGLKYHNGTILIRNGRLIDSNSLLLATGGTAFVATDGTNENQYANIVHVTNDGFQSPNLTGHMVYYGQIDSILQNGYGLKLKDARILTKNRWDTIANPDLTFSNDTKAVEDLGQSIIKIMPENEMVNAMAAKQYGYFYVKDGYIVAAHFLTKEASKLIKPNNDPTASIVSVGRIEKIHFNRSSSTPILTKITVRNVSQWGTGQWNQVANIFEMNIEQTTIIKDGKVISASDLKENDRLYLIHESQVKGRILLVN